MKVLDLEFKNPLFFLKKIYKRYIEDSKVPLAKREASLEAK